MKIKFENSDIPKKYFEFNKKIIINIKDLKNPYNIRIDLECSYNKFLLKFASDIYELDRKIEAKDFVLKNSKIRMNNISVE